EDGARGLVDEAAAEIESNGGGTRSLNGGDDAVGAVYDHRTAAGGGQSVGGFVHFDSGEHGRRWNHRKGIAVVPIGDDGGADEDDATEENGGRDHGGRDALAGGVAAAVDALRANGGALAQGAGAGLGAGDLLGGGSPGGAGGLGGLGRAATVGRFELDPHWADAHAVAGGLGANFAGQALGAVAQGV